MNNYHYTYQTFQQDAKERQEKAQQQLRANEIKPKTDDNRNSRKNRR